VHPLLQSRTPVSVVTGSLQWPVVNPDFSLRFEPGEAIRWTGRLHVAELRFGGPEDRRWHRVWALAGPVDCVVTDRRIIYRGEKVLRCTCRWAAIANRINDMADKTAIFVGQVRFQWPAAVLLTVRHIEGKPVPELRLDCQDSESVLAIVFTFVTAPEVEQIASGVARGLISDIGRFRLATRGRELGPERIRQLTAQRDNPTSVDSGTSQRWRLEGGLLVGQPPDKSAYIKRMTAWHDEGVKAIERHERAGSERALERALSAAKNMLENAIIGESMELKALNLYAGVLLARYESRGDLADLTTTIAIMRDLAERTADRPEWHATALSNLGAALNTRWDRGLSDSDLTEAIEALEAAVGLFAESSVNWASFASNLGTALRSRFPLTKDIADLNRAVDLCEQSLEVTPMESTDHADFLANLGFALFDRHRATGNARDLNRAVESLRAALNTMPSKAWNRSTVQMALADAVSRLQDHGGGGDRRAAVEMWRSACADSDSKSSAGVLKAAFNWSRAALGWRDWPMAAEACEIGLAATERLFRTQVLRENKALWLEEANGLPVRAAYALAKLGRLQQAVVTMERGRAVLLSEALNRGAHGLEGLAALGHDKLRVRFQQAAARFAELESATDNRESLRLANVLPGRQAEELRSAKAAIDDAIAAIRAVPGYERYLMPVGWPDIVSAAEAGPLAYIAYTEVGGVALTIDSRARTDPMPTVTWLDALTEEAVWEMVERYLRAYDMRQSEDSADRRQWPEVLMSTTRRLWDLVMGPLLSSVPADRIVLVPSGILALLPLHAAWHDDEHAVTGRRYAIDDALVTFTPSAQALQHTVARTAESAQPTILAVYDPDPGLPNTLREVHDAASWFTRGCELSRHEAPLDTLRAELTRYSVVHFSCHGSADLADPLRSGLEAASDGRLTLTHVLDQRLPNARLAVLSACETAVVGANVPDEVVGLPTGFVQAGVQGVIGSLWPVGDAVTCALMARFYELWRGHGAEPAEALRQAQRWVRDSTLGGIESSYPEIAWPWEASDHPGLDPAMFVLSNPMHWAAFQYVGT
jgi:CHAT domain-containing protein/tetratricopeptide (TPR) repeat protein